MKSKDEKSERRPRRDDDESSVGIPQSDDAA
jgi:hypothetical protein